MWHKDSSSATLAHYGYTYDAASNVSTRTDSDGTVTTFGYDNSDQLTSEVRDNSHATGYTLGYRNGEDSGMVRPDQLKFNLMSRHLHEIDENLYRFSVQNQWEVRKNSHRQPGRELQKTVNALLMISLTPDEHWLHTEYSLDMLHTVAIGCIFQPEPGLRFFRQELLLQSQPFSVARAQLPDLLTQAASRLVAWSLPQRRADGFYDFSSEWKKSDAAHGHVS